MSKTFDLIVFDWDGTLMDSAAAIVKTLQAAARALDLQVPDDERARHIIGLGMNEALRYALPDLPEAQYERVHEYYNKHFLAIAQKLELFPGIRELLAYLRGEGHLLAVATGKSRAGLARSLEQSGLGHLFHATRCASECFSKPHPEMLHELMDELDVTPGRTLMIGDTTHDLQMANNAGVAGLGVSYGAHPLAALQAGSPLAVVDTPAALSAWLRANA